LAKERFKKEPVALGDLMRQASQRLGLGRNQEHNLVFQAWENIFPEKYRTRMHPTRFYSGCLSVAVSSAPLLEEMRCYRQSDFLALLNDELSRLNHQSTVVVRKLDFRRN
jgi:hypothetical protein